MFCMYCTGVVKVNLNKENNKIAINECVSVDLFDESKSSSRSTIPYLEIISEENEKEQNVSGQNKTKI